MGVTNYLLNGMILLVPPPPVNQETPSFQEFASLFSKALL